MLIKTWRLFAAFSLIITARVAGGAGRPSHFEASLTKNDRRTDVISDSEIIERYRVSYLNFVEREQLTGLRVCDDLLAGYMSQRNRGDESWESHWRRRRVLQANLPAYAWDQNVDFFLDRPGLQVSFGQSPYCGSLHLSEINAFVLAYDPARFSRLSLIRRMFGTKRLTLNRDDIVAASECRLVGEEGTVVQIYLGRSPRRKLREGGGMIMISRDTGRVRLVLPGTDVDGEFEALLRGSPRALLRIFSGLIAEFQDSFVPAHGVWSAAKPVHNPFQTRRGFE